MNPLHELFPDGDFRFHLTLRRSDPRAYFRNKDESGHQLTERRRWIASNPSRYTALLPEGEPQFAELLQPCAKWNVISSAKAKALTAGLTSEGLRELGETLEPDFLLLSPDGEGRFRLRGGVLCFPTGWALEDKLGETLEFIHDVVPDLNAKLSSPIHQMFSRLKPDLAYERDNWGITASDELNLHPLRAVPELAAPVPLQGLWLRVEHQALISLPASKGVLFGIRIALHRLDEISRDRALVAGLIHALETMPDALAVYKKLAAVRASLINRLRQTLS